jgi:hypothetical protein
MPQRQPDTGWGFVSFPGNDLLFENLDSGPLALATLAPSLNPTGDHPNSRGRVAVTSDLSQHGTATVMMGVPAR